MESVINFTKEVTYEIIVVDNNSTECSADLFKEKFPSIILVKSPENGGFAKGNNLGIAVAKGEFILLLNSDTYLEENAISKTLYHYEKNKLNGIIGCKMTYPDGRIQHTARRFRSIQWELLDLFRFILYLLPYKKRATLMLGKYFKADCNTTCDWINGAFFLFPKEILAKLTNNKLDESFFMYGEDQLWCWQFKQLGYNAYFFADTKIIHINNGSTQLSKQVALLDLILKKELIIMRKRKGRKLYYYVFAILYGGKEKMRIAIKKLYFQLTKKILK
jgi:GT2 family glycosyltransferase